MVSNNYSISREKMVEQQLKGRGISNELILDAFRKIPREKFVPESMKHNAYKDTPLPIGNDQTISQPYIIARMIQLLNLSGNEKVLEIGTGSGYQTAILCKCAHIVYSIERIKKFTKNARKILDRIGCYKAHLITKDGTLGYPEKAPFDRIIISASGPEIPQPLIDQLAMDGVIVGPVGGSFFQNLIVLKKTDTGIKKEKKDGCRFVPLIGREGWKEK